jgi:hypothetical protein
VIIPSHRPASRGFTAAVALAAVLLGLLAARRYAEYDLTLSHYDARGHLVVARRIFDSITPGWRQIGAVWLPLPHLLNALPVQVDAFYRSGASAVALSIGSFALAAGALAALLRRVTGSAAAAAAGAAVFVLNPNLLYLQATPMTEPLLLGLILLAVARLVAWCEEDGRPGGGAKGIGLMFALACLTRYEAWPVTALALALAAWARRRAGDSWPEATRSVAAIAIYPAMAIAAFAAFSRAVVGEWFVTAGFFVPDNPAQGRPMAAARQIGWGLGMLSGPLMSGVAVFGLAALLVAARHRQRAAALVAMALGASAALPWLAFFQGHPFRIRYMVPLLAVQAVGVGAAIGVPGGGRLARWRPVLAAALAVAAIVELRPLALDAPMIVEAQWDRPNAAAREAVTVRLRAEYGGETIMASMGSLGHYMQELSRAGFDLRDFLHEGNGDLWLAALEGARPFAGWVLIEEQAEGGDMLAAIAHEDPRLLEGFTRVAAGGGVALYRRLPP